MARGLNVQITRAALKTIRRHLTAAYPFEGCGFLLGEPESAGEPVVLSALVRNNKRIPDGAARTRYLISPNDFLAAERDAAGMSLHVVGTYHSHPDVAARPSGYDLEHAWPWYRYLILSIVDGVVREERVWELRSDRRGFIEHTVHLKDQ